MYEEINPTNDPRLPGHVHPPELYVVRDMTSAQNASRSSAFMERTGAALVGGIGIGILAERAVFMFEKSLDIRLATGAVLGSLAAGLTAKLYKSK